MPSEVIGSSLAGTLYDVKVLYKKVTSESRRALNGHWVITLRCHYRALIIDHLMTAVRLNDERQPY
jgi:hypothetical protein